MLSFKNKVIPARQRQSGRRGRRRCQGRSCRSSWRLSHGIRLLGGIIVPIIGPGQQGRRQITLAVRVSLHFRRSRELRLQDTEDAVRDRLVLAQEPEALLTGLRMAGIDFHRHRHHGHHPLQALAEQAHKSHISRKILRCSFALAVLSPCDCGCHGKARYFPGWFCPYPANCVSPFLFFSVYGRISCTTIIPCFAISFGVVIS